MNGYLTPLISLELESHQQMQYSVISRTLHFNGFCRVLSVYCKPHQPGARDVFNMETKMMVGMKFLIFCKFNVILKLFKFYFYNNCIVNK